MSPEERAIIVDVLCGQSLADNLGDIRDEERHLWALLGVPELPDDHRHAWSDSAWVLTRSRLVHAGEALPEHLRYDEEDL